MFPHFCMARFSGENLLLLFALPRGQTQPGSRSRAGGGRNKTHVRPVERFMPASKAETMRISVSKRRPARGIRKSH